MTIEGTISPSTSHNYQAPWKHGLWALNWDLHILQHIMQLCAEQYCDGHVINACSITKATRSSRYTTLWHPTSGAAELE